MSAYNLFIIDQRISFVYRYYYPNRQLFILLVLWAAIIYELEYKGL